MSTVVNLNSDQAAARDAVVDKIDARQKLITLGGYAGTGKTTTIAEIARILRSAPRSKRISFMAFTGKAATVLKPKLDAVGALAADEYCGTIHGLIYSPIFNSKGLICGFNRRENREVEGDVFVVDEASMVDGEIFKDLQSFGRPIIAVGDHGQLPPVMGSFNLMKNPELKLERIMRQEEGNPIIRVSILAREEGSIPAGEHGPDVVRTINKQAFYELPWLAEAMIISARNATRVRLNRYMRSRLGFSGEDPQRGERVICLRNNAEHGIFNGMTGDLIEVKRRGAHWLDVRVQIDGVDGALFEGQAFRHQFGNEKTIREWPKLEPWMIGDQFDWAYALTCHKAQGSESDSVVVIEERMGRQTDDDWRRWLYTAVTRARRRLWIFAT